MSRMYECELGFLPLDDRYEKEIPGTRTSIDYIGLLSHTYNTLYSSESCDNCSINSTVLRVPSRNRWWVVIPLLSA